jgi:hypothetical protein
VPALAAKVVEVARELREDDERVGVVVEINGVGGGVYDLLKLWVEDKTMKLDWFVVKPFDAGSSAINDDQYVNRRSELWFSGQEFLKDGGALPDDRRMKLELVAPTYGFDSRLRRKVESKDDIKKKTKRSPDVADSVLISLINVELEPVSYDYDVSSMIRRHVSPIA